MRRAALIAFLLLLTGCQDRKQMESDLRLRLLEVRSGIDQYTYNKQHGPESLDELVRTGYLHEIPLDPCTGKADWTTITCQHYKAMPNDVMPGLCDVKSACKKKTKEGVAPYSTW
jgi:general secretion pathway protein G